MSLSADISSDGDTLLVSIPLKRRWRGGRRLTVAGDPAGERSEPAKPQLTEDPMLKALGRAWRWKRLLKCGGYSSIAQLAAEERVDKAYLSRLLRLTLLAPSILESILDGTMRNDVLLKDIIDAQVVDWMAQQRRITAAGKASQRGP